MTVIPRFRRKEPSAPTGTMTVMEHLEELRHRIVVSALAILAGAVGGWFLYNRVITFMQRPYCDYVKSVPPGQRPIGGGCKLIFSGMLDGMLVKVQLVFYLGCVLALPILLYQLWGFIVPGLKERERKMVVPFITSSLLLFAAGVAVAIITLPKALEFLLGFNNPSVASPLISVTQYVTFYVLVAIAFGVSFLFPVVLVFLQIVGVLHSAQLRSTRRYSVLGIAIFAAVITPSSDPYTMLALMIPMVLFYEAAIIVGRAMKK
ncbi:MAG: sec-independent protein translocase protein TatC [Actinomycetota bacterium]|jgi:sec-independent protein translocase protein TatC|nr:sec-independent protein translocase protein TatC [Actinomycetota bacterium]MEA2580488.1 sec-independent protein translocase protein TatC [Actinomycetota bacterium]